MRNRFAILVGLLLFAVPGCLYNGGYPYGYYGPNPSVVPQQPWPNSPGGTYQPQPYAPYSAPMDGTGGTYVPSNPSTGGPPNSSPLNSNPPTYAPGGNAPTYNPTPSNGGVPTPMDDTPSGNNDSGSNSPNLTPTQQSRVQEDQISTPFQQDNTRIPRNFRDDSTAESESEFQQPIRQTSQSAYEDTGLQETKRAALTSSPYGHHPKMEWLKGTVEFDEAMRHWVMIYDDNPPRSDALGGVVTLVGNAGLKQLQDEAVVRVSGALDRTATDGQGKPVYRVTKVEILGLR